jgi:hypothetical protein
MKTGGTRLAATQERASNVHQLRHGAAVADELQALRFERGSGQERHMRGIMAWQHAALLGA